MVQLGQMELMQLATTQVSCKINVMPYRGYCWLFVMDLPIKSAKTDRAPIQSPPNAAAVGMYLKDGSGKYLKIVSFRKESARFGLQMERSGFEPWLGSLCCWARR